MEKEMETESESETETIKCLVVGDKGIGKTCMLITYTSKSCPEEYIPTIFDYYKSNIEIDGRLINLQLIDTAGQEDYNRFRPLTYPNTDVFLICFSVINSESFRNVQLKWHPEVKKHCASAKILLVGTQIDMYNDEAAINKLTMGHEKVISRCEGLEMAKNIGAVEYLECSAENQTGLHEVFKAITRCCLMPLPIEEK